MTNRWLKEERDNEIVTNAINRTSSSSLRSLLSFHGLRADNWAISNSRKNRSITGQRIFICRNLKKAETKRYAWNIESVTRTSWSLVTESRSLVIFHVLIIFFCKIKESELQFNRFYSLEMLCKYEVQYKALHTFTQTLTFFNFSFHNRTLLTIKREQSHNCMFPVT